MDETESAPRRATELARLELARLAADVPLAEAFAKACEVAAATLGVERVGVWLFVDDGAALRCAALFERTSREHSDGTILHVADFPSYFAAMNVRKAVPAEYAATDPRTAELAAAYLNPLGITSVLDAGIFKDAELVGVVCHEHVGPPREWSTEERDFAGSVADLLAVRIQAAEVGELRAAFRRQEDRLADCQKAVAVEQVAAGLAHDFRNLLMVISGNGTLLADTPGLPADAREQARAVVDAAERGGILVRELMDFARPSAGPPAVLNLADATTDFLPVLRAAVGGRHQVRFARPAAVGHVLVGKSQFTRIVLNLVINARDATGDAAAPIDIRVCAVRLKDDANSSGNYVMLEVADRGSGMDDATRRRAFDPFFTTKSTGTGLGLAVVRRLADRAGGFVRLESAPGSGTTVRVLFPRVGASSGATGEYAIPPDVSAHGRPS